MLVGHFAVALAGKRLAPKLSLGTLAVAAMLPDLLWPIFLTLGWEHVVYRPGHGAGQYLDFAASQMEFSHSLVMDLVWAVLLIPLYRVLRGQRVGGLILLPAVLSHWVLDVISDRSLPLIPTGNLRWGLGLWSSIPLTLLVEGGLWVAAIVIYLRGTRSRSRSGAVVFWLWCVLLTLVWYNNIAGPPPPNPRTVPLVTLLLFSLLVACAYWINRLRPARTPVAASAGAGLDSR